MTLGANASYPMEWSGLLMMGSPDHVRRTPRSDTLGDILSLDLTIADQKSRFLHLETVPGSRIANVEKRVDTRIERWGEECLAMAHAATISA